MELNKKLKNISQCIVSIQGEGPLVGVPSLIIRFKQCNLTCEWCDTKWSGKYTGETFTLDSINRLLLDYDGISNVTFTGGEPFLYIDEIVDLMKHISKFDGNIDSFEIETNGSLHTKENMSKLLHGTQHLPVNVNLNISPKLEVSSHPTKTKFKDILKLYYDNYQNVKDVICGQNRDIIGIRYVYKFVYDFKYENSINTMLLCLNVPKNKIFMMALTPDMDSYDDLNEFYDDFAISSQKTIKFCLNHGFRMSCREHIWIYGKLKNEHIDSYI